jgi:hypothetical protein
MTDQEQIDALKAQVNALRVALEVIEDENSDECKGLSLIAKTALELTPEQCLAKHDAQIIGSMMNVLDKSTDALSPLEVIYVCDIERYINNLQEQAK